MKKVSFSKLLSMILVFMMVMSLMACSSDDSNEATLEEGQVESTKEEKKSDSSGDTEKTLDDPFAEPMTITIGQWGADGKFEGDPLLDLLEEKFNVEFEGVGVGWDDYKEKFKLWAASGELPDIFSTDELNSKTFEAWVEQGVIRALPKDLSAYPYVEATMNQEDIVPLQVDGSHYMIPRLTYPSTDMWALDRGILIRKDWLEDLGLEVPTTFDEYKEVLTAFVENDPDGNGENDTVGLTLRAMPLLQIFFHGTVPQVTNDSWIEEDGQWIPAYYSKGMFEGISQYKELFSEGLLDPDFVLLKDQDGVNKFAQGKAGIVATQATPGHLQDVKKRWIEYGGDEADFEDSVELISPWKHKDGNTYSFTQTTYWSESYFSSNVEDAKIDRIMRIYDFLKSPEFEEIKMYGLEGVDFTKDGDKYIITRETNEDGSYVGFGSTYPSYDVFSYLAAWDQQLQFIDNELNRSTYGDDVVNMVAAYLEKMGTEVKPMPVDFSVKLLRSPAKTDISTIQFMDDVIQVMLSSGDVEEDWQATREEYLALGLDKAIEEITALANK